MALAGECESRSAIVAIVVVLFAVLTVGLTAALAWWMLEPINRAGGHLRLSPRFMLCDVLGLMALLQAPLAIVGQALDTGSGRDNSHYWVILGVFVLLILVLWAAAVSVVSRAGITRVAKRLTVIVLLIPGTLAVIVSWPLGLVGLAAAVAESPQYPGFGQVSGFIVMAIAGVVSLVSLMVIIRRLSFWSLTGSPAEPIIAGLPATGPLPTPFRRTS
jgi:hypothetical protein